MINLQFSYLEIYIFIVSLFSHILYGYDKFKAVQNLKDIRRISEKNLLLSTLIGGTIGSVIAMFLFRHKVKKLSFLAKFFLVIAIQILLIYFYIHR